ncbi:MAG: hypothetical protein P857_1064 [Candidatus Xenolissoclinum pacificiensis L6]|uniref:Uncharacterized protein n=1 Tax=Candidatus Xenolissoclinum pacificiensis L6 TaxID=1401685 RepID=W2V0U2_9RICK|nr:MAG: hypothetical protein P857_1064 [Candidatus Xenolissoclinum pacificiensis L6]
MQDLNDADEQVFCEATKNLMIEKLNRYKIYLSDINMEFTRGHTLDNIEDFSHFNVSDESVIAISANKDLKDAFLLNNAQISQSSASDNLSIKNTIFQEFIDELMQIICHSAKYVLDVNILKNIFHSAPSKLILSNRKGLLLNISANSVTSKPSKALHIALFFLNGIPGMLSKESTPHRQITRNRVNDIKLKFAAVLRLPVENISFLKKIKTKQEISLPINALDNIECMLENSKIGVGTLGSVNDRPAIQIKSLSGGKTCHIQK